MQAIILENWDKRLVDLDYDAYSCEAYVSLYRQGQDSALCFFAEDLKNQFAFPFILKRENDGRPKLEAVSQYGYGGPVYNCDDEGFIREATSLFFEKLIGLGAVSLFARFNPIRGNWRVWEAFLPLTYRRETVAISQLTQLNSKLRNELAKAEANGAVFNVGLDADRLVGFKLLYSATMERANADSFYRFTDEYFMGLLNIDRGKIEYVGCEIDGKLASAALFLVSDGIAYYHLACSDPNFSHLSANTFLINRSANHFLQNGCRLVFLGGGTDDSKENSLLRFKKKFANMIFPYFTMNYDLIDEGGCLE